MSLVKKLSYHKDLLKEKEKILIGSEKENNQGDSTFWDLEENDIENWKKSQSEEIAILRNWIKKQPHLPQCFNDEDFLMFLHSCYYSVEQTKAKIESYCTIRTHAPEIFTNRNITSKELQLAQKVTRISPMRCATPEGYNVIFIDSVDPDIANFSFTESMKVAGIAIDILVRYYPKEEGNILVFDMQRSALAHVIKTNLTILKKAMIYVQKALPFRLKQVHVINAFPLIQQIQMLVKPFLDDNLSKLIHIHMQDNMDTLYKFIPKESLPKDYGGERESLQELNDKLKEMMHSHESYLKDREQYVVDENKRMGKAKNSSDVFGLEGSFRRLEID